MALSGVPMVDTRRHLSSQLTDRMRRVLQVTLATPLLFALANCTEPVRHARFSMMDQPSSEYFVAYVDSLTMPEVLGPRDSLRIQIHVAREHPECMAWRIITGAAADSLVITVYGNRALRLAPCPPPEITMAQFWAGRRVSVVVRRGDRPPLIRALYVKPEPPPVPGAVMLPDSADRGLLHWKP